MTHKKYEELMNLYIDGNISESEEKDLFEHLEECDDCFQLFEELKLLKDILSEEELLPLPDDFEDTLHDKLVASNKMKKNIVFNGSDYNNEDKVNASNHESDDSSQSNDSKKNKKISKVRKIDFRKASTALAACFALVGLIALSADSLNINHPVSMNAMYESDDSQIYFTNDTSMDSAKSVESKEFGNSMESIESMPTFDMNDATGDYEEGNTASLAPEMSTESTQESEYRTSQMIIKTGNISLQTADYDATFNQIVEFVESNGGYVEESNTYYMNFNGHNQETALKSGHMTIRIPSTVYDSFMNQSENYGDVTSLNESAQDITKQYRKVAEEIENLELTEARLRELLEEAEDMEDVLAIENELTRIRGQINNYTNQIEDWEDLVDMTTIYIDIKEVPAQNGVIKPIDNSLIGRSMVVFNNTLTWMVQGLEIIVISIIGYLPLFIVIVAVVVVIYLVIKLIKRRKK